MKKLIFLIIIIFIYNSQLINSYAQQTKFSHLDITLFDDYILVKKIDYIETDSPIGDPFGIFYLYSSKENFLKKIVKIYANNEELNPLTEELVKKNLDCFGIQCKEFVEGYGFIEENKTFSYWIFYKNKGNNKIETISRQDYNDISKDNYKKLGIINNVRNLNIFPQKLGGDETYNKIIIHLPTNYYPTQIFPNNATLFFEDKQSILSWNFKSNKDFYINLKYYKPIHYVIIDFIKNNWVISSSLFLLTIIGTFEKLSKYYFILKSKFIKTLKKWKKMKS